VYTQSAQVELHGMPGFQSSLRLCRAGGPAHQPVNGGLWDRFIHEEAGDYHSPSSPALVRYWLCNEV